MKSNFNIPKVAIYCRLSKDDEQKVESVSIQNQKDMIEYCGLNKWCNNVKYN